MLIRGPCKRPEMPWGLFQKSKREPPNTAVGTMNGMSAKVSRMFIHLDFLRAISQAMGTAAVTSKAATASAIIKEFRMATNASSVS